MQKGEANLYFRIKKVAIPKRKSAVAQESQSKPVLQKANQRKERKQIKGKEAEDQEIKSRRRQSKAKKESVKQQRK